VIEFKKLEENAKIPQLSTEGAAGFDLFSTVDKTIYCTDRLLIGTGIAAKIPCGCVGIIKSRSSMAAKCIDVKAGVIDSDYRGEIKVMLNSDDPGEYHIKQGDKIAQLIVVPILTDAKEVAELDDTDRGGGGFGSTGR
jgi:dUTP pyrophosphatase